MARAEAAEWIANRLSSTLTPPPRSRWHLPGLAPGDAPEFGGKTFFGSTLVLSTPAKNMNPHRRSHSLSDSGRVSALLLGSVLGLFPATAGFPQISPVGAAALRRAEARDGFISGRIRNGATGSSLSSAGIEVQGTNISTVSDSMGNYLIAAPAGRYTLAISFTGLNTAHLPVEIVSGRNVALDVDLTSELYSMEPFTIIGLREGNALAIQEQRHAPNLKTVVATDAYGQPATNPGELIQRMAGVSTDIVAGEVATIYIRGLGPDFSTLLVDGDSVATSGGSSATRQYRIDQMGTANIKQIELIKAPTPDQDANAVAGFINMVTKRGFDQPERRISLSAGTMWNNRGFKGSPFQDRPDDLDLLSLSYSDVFGAFGGKKNLGVSFNLSRRHSTQLIDGVGSGLLFYGIGSAYANPVSNRPLAGIYGTEDYGSNYEALIGGGSADFKISEDAYVYVKFSMDRVGFYQSAYAPVFGRPNATANDFTASSTYEHSFLLPSTASTAVYDSYYSTRKSTTLALTAGGESKLFEKSATLSLKGSFSRAKTSNPNFTRLQATMATPGIGFELDRRGQDAWYPIITQTAGPSIYDAASYRMRTLTRQYSGSPNKLYWTRADFKKEFATAAPSYIAIGAKYSASLRYQEVVYNAFTFVGPDNVPDTADDSMALYALKDRSYLMGGHYGPFPLTQIVDTNLPGDPAKLPINYWAKTATDVYNSYNLSNLSNANYSDTISAAYISGHVDLGKLRILAGIRVEDTEVTGTSWVRNQLASFGGNSVGGTSLDPAVVAANALRAQKSFVRRNSSQGQYRNVFPGLHFVFEPVRSLLVRASYNKSISRPPVANLLPTLTENPDTRTVVLGNPSLKPYTSDNFEVSVERYFEPVGTISASVFLKEIKDYFRSITSTVGPEGIDGTGLYANYSLSTPINIGRARIRGFEVNYQQQFSFLPSFLSGFGAFANFTYTDTEGNFGALTTVKRLPQLSPRNANAGISFVKYGWQIRLLGNWRGLTYWGTSGPIDFYREPRLILDTKIEYHINRRYDLYLNVANITNQPIRADVIKNDALKLNLPWVMIKPGAALSAGVNARF